MKGKRMAKQRWSQGGKGGKQRIERDRVENRITGDLLKLSEAAPQRQLPHLTEFQCKFRTSDNDT